MATASYAITANFGSLSTDPKSPKCMSKEDGMAKAMANLQYIMRTKAVDPLLGGALLYRTDGLTQHVPMKIEERKAFIEMCDEKLSHRARKHTKSRGVRLLDKAIVSLPADANCHQRIEMAELAIAQFGGDSDATVVAAIHTDRPGNPHMHLWMVDGLEPREQAIVRTQARTKHTKPTRPKDSDKEIPPDKRRIRRQDYIRFGERKSFAKARLDVAAIINIVATREGLRRAQTRSLKEQGLDKKPQVHEGPQAAQKARREEHIAFAYHGILTPEVRRRVLRNIDTVIENNTQSFLNTESVRPTIFPERLRPFCIMVYELIEKKAQLLRSQLKLDLIREEKCKEIEAEALRIQKQVEQKRQQEEEHDATKENSKVPPTTIKEEQPPEKTRSIQAQPAMNDSGDFGQNLIRNKRLSEGRPTEYTPPQMSEEEYERLKSRPPIEIPEPFSKKVSSFAKQLVPTVRKIGEIFMSSIEEVNEARREEKRQKNEAQARAKRAAIEDERLRKEQEKLRDEKATKAAITAMVGKPASKQQNQFEHLDHDASERPDNLDKDRPGPVDGSYPILDKGKETADKATQLTRARYREPEIRITTSPPSRQQTRPKPPIVPTPKQQKPPITPSTPKPPQESNRGENRIKKRSRDRGMER